jgi:aspartate kinase
VLKFGGSSVEDAAAMERVAAIVADACGAGRPVVVTSAMRGVTDGLLGAVRKAAGGEVSLALKWTRALIDRHRDVAAALLETAARQRLERRWMDAGTRLSRLLKVLAEHPGTHRPLQDEVAAFGEWFTSLLLAEVLGAKGLPARWVDARRCIRTDEEYTCAAPLPELTREHTRAELLPVLARGEIPVLGGFVASSLQGATTTLGRGGSDYSAALLGAALDAREIQIWTDVSGFLTADPRVVATARTLPRLSYAEAAELAFFGAKVLHPGTIQPAVQRRIPVRVCNSRAPGSAQTVVGGEAEAPACGVRAVAHRTGVTIVRVTSARMLGAHGFLHAIFQVLNRHRLAADVVATSDVSVSLALSAPECLQQIVGELELIGCVQVEAGYAIVCIVGEGLRGTCGIAAAVFGVLADINVSLISQGASSTNLSFVVREPEAEEAVRRLHDAFCVAQAPSPDERAPGLLAARQ